MQNFPMTGILSMKTGAGSSPDNSVEKHPEAPWLGPPLICTMPLMTCVVRFTKTFFLQGAFPLSGPELPCPSASQSQLPTLLLSPQATGFLSLRRC